MTIHLRATAEDVNSAALVDDEMALARTIRMYDRLYDRLTAEIDRLESGGADDVASPKDVAEAIRSTEKTLMSILDIRGRLTTRLDKCAAAKGELDLDAARSEIEGRLARIAERG